MGTKEYHQLKSAESYQKMRLDPEFLEKRKHYATHRRQQKKAEAVKRFGSVCARCGSNYPDPVFEFHHFSDDKTETPAKLFLLTDDRINEELDKCIMLCANCHRVHHYLHGFDYLKKKYL